MAKGGKFTLEGIEQLAKRATKNAKSNKVMLGKFDKINMSKSYNIRAKKGNYTYFELDNWEEVSKSVNGSRDEMWKVNKQFLENEIKKGKDFYLSHDPLRLDKSYFYKREIEYLKGRGATFDYVKKDNIWKVNFKNK